MKEKNEKIKRRKKKAEKKSNFTLFISRHRDIPLIRHGHRFPHLKNECAMKNSFLHCRIRQHLNGKQWMFSALCVCFIGFCLFFVLLLLFAIRLGSLWSQPKIWLTFWISKFMKISRIMTLSAHANPQTKKEKKAEKKSVDFQMNSCENTAIFILLISFNFFLFASRQKQKRI